MEISKGYILPWWKDISAADQYSHNKERTVAESRIEAKSATTPEVINYQRYPWPVMIANRDCLNRHKIIIKMPVNNSNTD